MELTLIKFFKLKKLFKLHKRVIKEAYDSENMILNVSSIFGTKFKMDRASRLYAIVNPQVQDMKIELSEQIVEYNDQGKSTESYVRQWFMNRMFAIQRVLKEKELLKTLGMESSNFIEVYPKIYNSDFCTDHPTFSVSDRIIADIKWGINLKRQALNKTGYRKDGKN